MKWTKDIDEIVTVLKNGGLAIIPTDTVWGLSCSANRIDAIEHFYQVKHREKNKPTAILVGSMDQAQLYGQFYAQAKGIAGRYWPGALTIITKVHHRVPALIQGSTNTIGLRFPKDLVVMEITRTLGCGLVTGSANFAGEEAPTKKSEIDPKLLEQVDIAFDGECGGQPPSTVIDCTQDNLKVIRPGPVTIGIREFKERNTHI